MLAVCCVLLAACGKSDDNIIQYAPVNVHVSDFTITQDEMPSKTGSDPADYANAKAIVLAFYAADGTEMHKITQLKSDPSTYTTFGEFSCNLQVGTYTMVVVAYAHATDDAFSLSSPTQATFSSERPRETFCYTQSVTVTSSAPLNLSATLQRISAKVNLISTDGRPAEAVRIRTTFSGGGKSFSPSTGLSLNDNGFSQTNNPSATVGGLINVAIFPFLYTDEETMTVTFEVLDAADNVIITKVVPNVPLKRNRCTTLTGAVFTPGSSSSGFLLETDWLEGNTINF